MNTTQYFYQIKDVPSPFWLFCSEYALARSVTAFDVRDITKLSGYPPSNVKIRL